MGTTLQVPPHMWPATRADFETYWQDTLSTLVIDPPIREHLLAIARMEFAGPIVARIGGWWSYIMTVGFLPDDFRDKMGVELAPWQQTVFDVHNVIVRHTVRHLPKPLQQFPFNLLLADVRRRVRTGRPLV